METIPFIYEQAFSRNIGWVTSEEQNILRGKRIAIAGLGGVGGVHLLTLARLGIGAFNLADFDTFNLVNFNRQSGATMSTLGMSKLKVMVDQALDINPELDIRFFPQGVSTDNLDVFLEGVDVYVDGLDFFSLQARSDIFAACARQGVPAITAAPLGMGAALLVFVPGGMTFEEYFRLDGQLELEQAIRFLIGLSPAMLQRAYLADTRFVNLEEQKGPSTIMACQICAGVASSVVLKLLLNRGKVFQAPWALQFDAYRNRLVRTWRPWGNKNPIQRLALFIARRQLARMRKWANERR